MKLPLAVSLSVAALALAPPAPAQEANEPISIEVDSYLSGRSGLSKTIASIVEGNTEDTARDLRNALSRYRWLTHTSGRPEVRVRVERRTREEISRKADKKGVVSVTHRYSAEATVEIGDDVRRSVSADRQYTAKEGSYRNDDSHFEDVAGDLATRVVAEVASYLDELRPDRPRAGFSHQKKYRFLVKGDGLEVSNVEPGSPAEAAGLREKDRIRRIGTEKGTDQMDAIIQGWWTEAPGKKFVLEVERDKKRRMVELELAPPER